MFELRYLHHLDRDAKPLRIGSMTHKLLEQHNLCKESGQTFTPEMPEGADPDEWLVVEKLYNAYNREYGIDDIAIIQPEVKATAYFGTVTTVKNKWEIWLVGTLDGIIQDGGLYLEEYKTCANLGAAQFAKFMNDYQITAYMWMAKKALQITLDGARITLLPKTKDPQPARIRVVRTAHQFQEWERTTLHEVKSMIQCLEARYHPQRMTSCTNWNRACMFQDYCMTGEESNLVDLIPRGPDYTDDKRQELERLAGEEALVGT